MATLENVQAKVARLQTQAEALAADHSSGVISKIRDLMKKHGLTAADIEAHTDGKERGRKPGATTVAKAPLVKYRYPKTGATWTGRGRAPAWIASARCSAKLRSNIKRGFLFSLNSDGTLVRDLRPEMFSSKRRQRDPHVRVRLAATRFLSLNSFRSFNEGTVSGL
jgi:DNA-binding protein H-NS